MNERQYIMEILHDEDIRYIDGRYSKGFVDPDVLGQLVLDGSAEVYTVPSNIGDLQFVRKVDRNV